MKQIKSLTCNSKPVEEIFGCVANFIAREPGIFARSEIYKVLHEHLLASNEAENIMKCMAFLLSCDRGLELAEKNDFAKVLMEVLMNTNTEVVQTYAIVALKNYMLSKTAFKNVSFPWTDLVELLIKTSSTKKNILLQETSLQALRFISDKPSVKDKLRKVYKKKVAQIVCLSENAEELKMDLVPWINYRNYKAAKDEKYSKLFIWFLIEIKQFFRRNLRS